jgi:hypothetical protein
MKSKVLGLIIAVLLLTIAFSGCNEKKEVVAYSLKSQGLKVDDLPSGYIKLTEESNYLNFSNEETINVIKPLEFYYVTYAFNNTELNTAYPAIALTMFRFNTSDDAQEIMLNLSDNLINSMTSLLNKTTPQDIPQIGDESVYELFQGNMGEYYGYQNATWSFIYFRIGNVVVNLLLEGLMEWNIDYVELTFNYTRIIEDRLDTMLK